jgi:peroxiredoxin
MNILFSAILTLGLLNNDPATTPAPVGYAVGDVVNNFSLMNVDGNNVSLNDYKDKEGVIVVFTCNHCPYAKAYETRIMELDAKYAGLNYPVIAINPNDPIKEPDDSPENMKKRAEEKNYSFPYLFDATQQVAKDFGATRTPHVFLLQKVNGQFKVAYIGAIDDNTDDASKAENKFVEDAIASLKKGEQPVVSFTKAIGCTIKWK